MDINEKDDLQTEVLPDFSIFEEAQEELNEENKESNETLEEEDEIIDTPENKDSEEPQEEDIEAITAFYQMFQEKGILPEKEIKSFKDLEDEIEAYKESLPSTVKESLIESSPEDAKSLINYALTKPDVTREDLLNYLSAEQHDSVDISDNDSAREYLKSVYSDQLEEEALTAALDAMEDKGTLISKAEQMKESQTQKLLEQAEQERQANEEARQAQWQEMEREFLAQPWKEDHTQKVLSQWKDGTLDNTLQEVSQNPKALVQLANILSYYDKESNAFNLDTFFTKAQTKETSSIKNKIISSMQGKNKTTSKANPNKSTFDLDSFQPIK